jgi:signal transduction histidine kinase
MRRVKPTEVAGAAVVLACGAVVVGWPAPAGHGLDHPWLHAALATVLALQASVVARVEPRNPLGPLLAGVAVFAGLWVFAEAWSVREAPGATVARAFALWGWLPTVLVPHTVVLLLFPDGRLPGPRWRPVAWVIVAVTGLCVAACAVYPAALEPVPGPLGNPLRIPVPPETYLTWLTPLFGLAYASVVVAIGSLVWRWRTAGPAVRAQLAWPVLGALVGLVLVLLPTSLFAPLVPFVMPTAVAAAVRWRGLYSVDRLLSRSLVYLVGSLLLLGLLIGVVTASGSMIGRTAGLVPAIVATAVLMLAFDPVRRWLQRWIDRVVYGRRGDPAAAVSRLGARLSGMLVPDEVPDAIVEVIAESLGVHQVAVLGRIDGSLRTLAHRGGVPAGDDVLSVSLAGADGAFGRLLVGPRGPADPLTAADRRLVDELARHAGPAVHAALLAAEVRRARMALVLARDEERRRLRRELHDGLGSYLAGIGFGIDGIRRHVPPRQAAQLARVAEQATAATKEVRRIVDDLRPGPLERLGLLDAIRDLVDRTSGTGVTVTLGCPAVAPPLPVAVELAAYRIASEAVTNVVKHAGADRCDVTMTLTDTCLRLSIADNGAGLTSSAASGVGLQSMTARADALGGSVTVCPGEGGGTVVTAELPRGAPT